MSARSVVVGTVLVIVCVIGVLSGLYAYVGDCGTDRARRDMIARGQCLVDPNLYRHHNVITDDDLQDVPEKVREQYKDVVRQGSVLAKQGCWDKTVMYVQSLLLVILTATGLYSLLRAKD